jgi:hypothetical protein
MRAAVAVLIAILLPATAAAQLPDHPLSNASGTLTAGAEVSASVSRRDDLAFFNYTDYDTDALRMARLRLLSEWRPHAQLSVLGELRVATGARVEAAALFARWRPVARWNFDVQAGRVPPVIGAFSRRAYGRDNPLVGIPLAYQYLTSLRPDALPATVDDLLRMRARGWQPSFPIGSQSIAPGLPLVSAFQWDTGIVAHWSNNHVDLAASVTRGAPARPVVKETNHGVQWSGRAAVMSAGGLTVGLSAARGTWIDQTVLDLQSIASSVTTSQTVVGTDAAFERGHWILRGELMHVGFGIPIAASPSFTDPLTSTAGFVEARYRFLSRWQIAGRAERLTFSQVTGTLFSGAPTPWDAQVSRLEATVGLRLARTLEVRGGYQYNWRNAGRVHNLGYSTAQLIYWF